MSHLTQNTIPVGHGQPHPHPQQQHHSHPHLRAAPGMVAGREAGHVVSGALAGTGLGRTAGVVTRQAVGKNVNKFAHQFI